MTLLDVPSAAGIINNRLTQIFSRLVASLSHGPHCRWICMQVLWIWVTNSI